MLHIAGALGSVLHFSAVADNIFQQLKCLIQIETRPGCNVEDLPGHLFGRGFRREQIGGDHIINVSEIATLRSIAEN